MRKLSRSPPSTETTILFFPSPALCCVIPAPLGVVIPLSVQTACCCVSQTLAASLAGLSPIPASNHQTFFNIMFGTVLTTVCNWHMLDRAKCGGKSNNLPPSLGSTYLCQVAMEKLPCYANPVDLHNIFHFSCCPCLALLFGLCLQRALGFQALCKLLYKPRTLFLGHASVCLQTLLRSSKSHLQPHLSMARNGESIIDVTLSKSWNWYTVEHATTIHVDNAWQHTMMHTAKASCCMHSVPQDNDNANSETASHGMPQCIFSIIFVR